MSVSDESLVKILVDISNDDQITGESFWAEPLGNDLYRLRNTPFHAYDLHFYDIVRAVPRAPDEIPTITAVVQPSGHKTLRVLFSENATEELIQRVLLRLKDWKASFEHARGRFYAIDVEPDGDYPTTCDYLWKLEQDGWLHYETGTTTEGGCESGADG